MMKYLGKIIHELRLEKNLTIETLAYHAGISVSHMGYIERGTKTNIQMDTLENIAKALDIKPYQLLLYCDQLATSCPMANVLVSCVGCEKNEDDALICRTSKRINTAEQLLTDSNISHIKQIKKTIAKAQPEYLYSVSEEIMCSEENGYYKTYGIQCCHYSNPSTVIFKVSDVSVEKQNVSELTDLCNIEKLEPIHLMDVIYDFILTT